MECLSIRIEGQGEGLKSAMMRYDMLLRASKTMRRCGVQMLAFGLNERQIRERHSGHKGWNASRRSRTGY